MMYDSGEVWPRLVREADDKAGNRLRVVELGSEGRGPRGECEAAKHGPARTGEQLSTGAEAHTGEFREDIQEAAVYTTDGGACARIGIARICAGGSEEDLRNSRPYRESRFGASRSPLTNFDISAWTTLTLRLGFKSSWNL